MSDLERDEIVIVARFDLRLGGMEKGGHRLRIWVFCCCARLGVKLAVVVYRGVLGRNLEL